MGHHRIEDIGAFGLPLGGEGAALPAAERDDAHPASPAARTDRSAITWRLASASCQSASLRNMLSGGTG